MLTETAMGIQINAMNSTEHAEYIEAIGGYVYMRTN